jgi:hypothetical protein
MRYKIAGLLILPLLGVLACSANAAQLKVGPPCFMLQNLKPGQTYDIFGLTGLRLTIYNDGDTAQTWQLSMHRPTEFGAWEKGYAAIPDAKWCWFEKDEVTVDARSVGFATFFVQIPEGEQYYNQHWMVSLHIKAKPSPGLAIGVAATIRAQIETKESADTKVAPAGGIGMRPALVQFEEVELGATRTAQAEIFNNSDKPHTYKISSLFAGKVDKEVYLTAKYETLPDTNWLGREAQLEIPPGKSSVLHLTLNAPNDPALLGQKWEELLLIQPEEGLSEFVRVRVEMKEKPPTN